MLKNKFLVLNLSLLIIYLSNCIFATPMIRADNKDSTGVRLTVKEELIHGLEKDFLPQIIKILGNYTLENQTISYDL